MSVTHKIDHDEKTLTISVSGRFDFTSHPAFRDSYREIENKSYAVTVDLKDTENMDSAALGMLLILDESFPDQRVKLINTNSFVKQVLNISHFGTKFDIS